MTTEKRGDETPEPSPWETLRVYYYKPDVWAVLWRDETDDYVVLTADVLRKCGFTTLEEGERVDVRCVPRKIGAPLVTEIAYPVGFVW